MGQDGQTDEELDGVEGLPIQTVLVSTAGKLTVERVGETDQEAEDQDTGQQPVAIVGAAQVEVERHLEVSDVGHDS